jgi:hypothetical protein
MSFWQIVLTVENWVAPPLLGAIWIFLAACVALGSPPGEG